MIVRDEASVIERCLASVRDHIDHWVICDTGSTDGTQELVRQAVADLPGELQEHKWVDFGTNRTQALKLADGTADYLLILDADTTLEVADGALAILGADAYMLGNLDAGVTYHTKRLVKSGLDWRYIGAVHEYIESPRERSCEQLPGVHIRTWSVGALRSGRFERDRALLEASVAADPDNARDVFYLAQTHRDLHDDAAALEFYRRRAVMGGWEEEAYCAWHQAALIHDRLGDWPSALEAYLRAYETRPQRLEAVHDLAVGLLERRQFHTAYTFTRVAAAGPLPLVPDVLFVQPSVYAWGLAYQHVVAAYWVGDYDGAITVARRLIDDPAVPDAHRAQTRENLEFALTEKARQTVTRSPPRTWPNAGQATRGRPT
jgi:tetratricopeptide (TPR) repeat protein